MAIFGNFWPEKSGKKFLGPDIRPLTFTSFLREKPCLFRDAKEKCRASKGLQEWRTETKYPEGQGFNAFS